MSEEKKENYTHSIELIGGIETIDKKTKETTLHQKVTFGRRLTIKDLILIESDPQSSSQTLHEDLIRRKMITELGTLNMPVTLPQLLSLDRVDRQDIAEAANYFLQISRDERKGEFLPDNKVKLFFGFKIADVIYDIVHFGTRLTGNDEVEADRLGLQGIRRVAFELGKQITKLESSENNLSIDGAVGLDAFESLDGDDFNILRVGGEMFTQSFRLKRKKV